MILIGIYLVCMLYIIFELYKDWLLFSPNTQDIIRRANIILIILLILYLAYISKNEVVRLMCFHIMFNTVLKFPRKSGF